MYPDSRVCLVVYSLISLSYEIGKGKGRRKAGGRVTTKGRYKREREDKGGGEKKCREKKRGVRDGKKGGRDGSEEKVSKRKRG